MIGSVSYGFFKNNILTVLKVYAEYSKQKFPPHYINFFFSFFHRRMMDMNPFTTTASLMVTEEAFSIAQRNQSIQFLLSVLNHITTFHPTALDPPSLGRRVLKLQLPLRLLRLPPQMVPHHLQ